MKNILVSYGNYSNNLNLKHIPDTCPICKQGIDPHFQFAYCNKDRRNKHNCLEVIHRCTKHNCDNLFIAYYQSSNLNCDSNSNWSVTNLKPITKDGRVFSETIKGISEGFVEIYNQALCAEQDGLYQICGVGYRKAIEFLIKDYIISKGEIDNQIIKEKFLGNCIKDCIPNDNIKKMAERAVWLGNDETHYTRKWETKDLQDLKKLIDATLYRIEMEKLSEDALEEMP